MSEIESDLENEDLTLKNKARAAMRFVPYTVALILSFCWVVVSFIDLYCD